MGTYLHEIADFIVTYTTKHNECPTLEMLRKIFAPFKKAPIPLDYFSAFFAKDENGAVRVCPDLWTLWTYQMSTFQYGVNAGFGVKMGEAYKKWAKGIPWMSSPEMGLNLNEAWLTALEENEVRKRIEIIPIEKGECILSDCDFTYNYFEPLVKDPADYKRYLKAINGERFVLPFRFFDPLNGNNQTLIVAEPGVLEYVRVIAECSGKRPNSRYIDCGKFKKLPDSRSLFEEFDQCMKELDCVYNWLCVKSGIEIKTINGIWMKLEEATFPLVGYMREIKILNKKELYDDMDYLIKFEAHLNRFSEGAYLYGGEIHVIYNFAIPSVSLLLLR